MKRKMTILLVALLSLSVTVRAQWAVFDPSNFAQSIVNSANEIVQTSTTAQNMWSNFQETVKIYQQGKAYYDALKSVHDWKSHSTLTLLATQNYPFWLKYD